jgi:hypothetical protein
MKKFKTSNSTSERNLKAHFIIFTIQKLLHFSGLIMVHKANNMNIDLILERDWGKLDLVD